jgi:hypothetical protein
MTKELLCALHSLCTVTVTNAYACFCSCLTADTRDAAAASLLCRWVGVLTSYLLRPSAKSLQRHAEFRGAVVGVHIRRTDKVTPLPGSGSQAA